MMNKTNILCNNPSLIYSQQSPNAISETATGKASSLIVWPDSGRTKLRFGSESLDLGLSMVFDRIAVDGYPVSKSG